MTFEKIEDKVQLGHRGYVRHKIEDLPIGELVQRCVLCGQVIEDYRPPENGFIIRFNKDGKIDKEEYEEKGMPAGWVYLSVENNPRSCMHEMLKSFGVVMPTDYIDCTVVNS